MKCRRRLQHAAAEAGAETESAVVQWCSSEAESHGVLNVSRQLRGV